MTKTLDRYRRIHIVGAGGAGMSGLAKLLSVSGHEVTGSDLRPGNTLDALGDVGVETWVGHRPGVADTWDLVVASSAVPDSDPELGAANRLGVEVWRRPQLLGAMTDQIPAIGFAGTHGKTTCTALAVTALRSLGEDPTFLVGGEMVAFNSGAHLGDPALFVLEADEAFGTFRHLHLSGLLVSNIEADHLDHYGTVAQLEEAFAQVAQSTEGSVVACIDDPGVRRLAERTAVVGYGVSRQASWRIENLLQHSGGVQFALVGPGGTSVDVAVPRPGAHVALNAAGVLALLGERGYDVALAASGLATYAGVRRRYEVRSRVGGVTIVDDYAHHPTEIAATVAAARSTEGGRIWAVFQPHRYSRTADLAPEFGEPLAGADQVVVTDVYPAGEAPIPGVSGRIVAEAVAAAGGDVEYVARLGDVPDHLGPRLESGDLVLLLGAGDVASIADPLAEEISRSMR